MQPVRGPLLLDKQQRLLGRLTVDQVERDLLSGTFSAEPAFQEVALLFRAFEEAVDLQALRVVDELDHTIAALGLHLWHPTDNTARPIHDVQIWSDGGMTCRLTDAPPTPANGVTAATTEGSTTCAAVDTNPNSFS